MFQSNATILLEESLVTLKPIRVFLQRPAFGQPILVEIRFHHLFVSCQLYVADLPFIWSPSHGTQIYGQKMSTGNSQNSGASHSQSSSRISTLQKKTSKLIRYFYPFCTDLN